MKTGSAFVCVCVKFDFQTLGNMSKTQTMLTMYVLTTL